jgi:serine/threonine protein kinase
MPGESGRADPAVDVGPSQFMNASLAKSAVIEKISVANYKIVEMIGRGGMANIYKAIQLSLDRPVALKIMHPHLSLDEGFVARFEQEAKQAAQLHHENIVSIIDYGQEYGDYYIAMEYVEGTNLRDIIKRQKRLPLELSFLICHQVAEGLKFAHSHNIIHRDIKPANIILSDDGRVMITDFGIAKAGNDMTITATGQMIGSPAYMSPEQAAGRLVDRRSDIFSLGIILYEALAGVKPFSGETYQAMVASIMSDKAEPLMKLRVDVNEEIEAIIDKAIAKDPQSRYQTVDDFADSLYGILEKFKLPPVRKLMSSFLKNPSKMTEKLRTEKISNHMESALYYLTLGEGRLKDARKEFAEVLRYDRNNKSAKQYLSRLADHQALSSRSAKGGGYITLKIRDILVSILALALIALAAYLVPWEGILKKVKRSIPARVVDASSKAGAAKGQSDDSGEKVEGATEKKKEEVTRPPSTASSKATSGSPAKEAVVKKEKKPVAKRTRSVYNYPEQNLEEYGLLSVKTNVAADVFIDMKKYGASNGPAIKLAPGRHFVEIKAGGYRHMTRRIFTDKDKKAELSVDLIPER